MQPSTAPFGSLGSGVDRSAGPSQSLNLPPSANNANNLGWQALAGDRMTADAPQPRPADNKAAAAPSVESEEQARRLRDTEAQNAELNKRLDEDGLQFLEALISLEGQVEELTRQNKKLIDERDSTEVNLLQQGSDGEYRAKIMKMERERQDMLQQLDEFEREKEEDLREQRETTEALRRSLSEVTQENARKKLEQEREREQLVELVATEGRENQVRIEKLVREKDNLNSELAKALARAEAAGAADESNQVGGGAVPSSSSNLSEANNQLRIVMSERETLRDEVTNKGGQILLLQSQLEIKDRKLRIADMENAMLKSELEVLRRNAALEKK